MHHSLNLTGFIQQIRHGLTSRNEYHAHMHHPRLGLAGTKHAVECHMLHFSCSCNSRSLCSLLLQEPCTHPLCHLLSPTLPTPPL